jgi:hypothetical protein
MTCKMFSVLKGDREIVPINRLFLLGKFGGRTRTRTLDPLIKSQLCGKERRKASAPCTRASPE